MFDLATFSVLFAAKNIRKKTIGPDTKISYNIYCTKIHTVYYKLQLQKNINTSLNLFKWFKDYKNIISFFNLLFSIIPKDWIK